MMAFVAGDNIRMCPCIPIATMRARKKAYRFCKYKQELLG